MLKVNAVVDVAETLTVGDSADNPLMVVNPDAQTIRFGETKSQNPACSRCLPTLV